MPIPLGILAAAGFRPSAAGSYDLLETTVLTGSQASVEFTNLTTKYASTYQHLQIRVALAARADDWMTLRFNGDTTGGNYYSHILRGTGSAVNSFATGAGSLGMGYLMNFGTTTSAGVLDILDPFETTKNKTVRMFAGNTTANSTGGPITLTSGLYMSTNSVTALSISAFSGTYTTGSRFSLYGLKAA